MSDPLLKARVILAMPKGPPYGGMTANTALFLKSRLFNNSNAAIFDTSPPASEYGTLSRFFDSLTKCIKLYQLIRSHQAQAIYFMSSDFLGFFEKSVMGMFCKLLGLKTSIHLVGEFIPFHRASAWRRPLINFCIRRFDAVFVVAENFRQYLSQLTPINRIHIVPNPVDVSLYQVENREPKSTALIQVLYAAPLIRDKGIIDLIEAIKMLRTELPTNLRILILGSGPLENWAKQEVEAHGLSQQVLFKGYVTGPSKIQLLKESHIFVLPTYTEALPVTLLEAMSSGMASLTTRVGGIPYSIKDGTHALLIEPGDFKALATKLLQLIQESSMRENMGHHASIWARENFDITLVAEKLAHYVNQL